MKCAANIRNFFKKFAVYCKFIVLLSKICSAFFFVKLITLSVICISENLYSFSFIARYIL